ncbi:hypothetical protein [Actinoplanes aureus]|uniref:Uncharacterized protein n=1 Tax=Actinoplanes aureus TaxID=2792083 RepID=A0A931CEQ8_9ACTN|nr:hypothetical protein [Actinoplanes aureus]MBG0567244.1 hypothetical protein [Actinoplanes aureus]
MSYEDDGNVAYVPVKVYDNGLAVPMGTTFHSDREQTQALVDCLNAKAETASDTSRYRVGGLAPLRDVPVGPNYHGPFHSLDDSCTASPA